MKAIRSRFVAFAATALVVAALGAERAEGAGGEARDDVFRAKGMGSRPLAAVAILPAVAVADDAKAEAAVEEGWLRLCAETKTRWVKPEAVAAKLRSVPGRGRDLAADVEAEIWRYGAVTSETAARVARVLGVDGVLSLRIDRWEVVDGGRGTVELAATLNGASGAKLWSIRGRAGHGGPRKSSEATWTQDMTYIWDPRLDPQPGAHRLGVALYALLARWSPEIPGEFYGDGPPPMLAGAARKPR